MARISDERAARWGYSGVAALRNSKKQLAFMVILVMIALWGYAVGMHGKIVGYRDVYSVTREIPWGMLIAGYIFCVVTSTGLCLVSCVGHVFGYEPYMPIAKRSVFLAIVFMLCGFSIIFFDIENPFRMAIWNVISPNFASNMWWMGTLYGLYLVALCVEYYFLLEQNHSFSRAAGFMGVLFGVAAHSNLGGIFGMLYGRQEWYGPYMPIYFIVSAMMSGGAAIIFFTCLARLINPEILDQKQERAINAVRQLTIMLICVIIFFTIWKVLCGIVVPEKYIAIHAFLIGRYAPLFWIGEVALGFIIPLVFLTISKGVNYKLMFWGSGLMVIGIFFMRYNLVLEGEVVPGFAGLHVLEYPELLNYTPSFHEVAIVIAGVSMTIFGFMFGEKVFNGHQFQKHEVVPAGAFICPGCGGIHYLKEGETHDEAERRHHKLSFRAPK
ncbi:NrfD/PsrC family molybdoenzyme membrane anchor subunit [Desulfobacterota bacterium M19]